MRAVLSALIVLVAVLALPATAQGLPPTRLLDGFDNISAWRALASDSVTASLRQVDGPVGKALCLDYDFNGVSGYAVARRELPMDYPGNYEYTLQLRGSGPRNNLEFKFGDASGDNVWWVKRPDYPMPAQWTPLKLKKRHIGFAWGPSNDKQLRSSQSFELTISAGNGGGRGEACIDQLGFRELPDDELAPPRPVATASVELESGPASNAVDPDQASAWRAPMGNQVLTLDLGRPREFGGLTLRWVAGLHASSYRIALSDDGRDWRVVRSVVQGNGGNDPIALPESEARYLRLQLDHGPGASYALADVAVEALAFAASANNFIQSIADAAPRGWFPRGFSGEQPYWTIVGIDGGVQQGLLGEDGAIELSRGGASIEPFVMVDGTLLGWADVEASQSLQDGYLPIPSVHWKHPALDLSITAFAQGTPQRSQLLARYRLANTGRSPRDYTLALAVRPLQVNPPSQFLSTPGGASPIHALAIVGGQVVIDGHLRVSMLQAPDAVFATPFDAGMAVAHLTKADLPRSHQASDGTGLVSGALLFRIRLQPGESREVDWIAPLSGDPLTARVDPQVAQAAVAKDWRGKLDRVQIRVPPQAQHVVDTLRSALAQMLVSRTGPRLQPGTRSYARAWIRDGAMISEGLLRLGREDVASEFLRWYAPYQFASGKVPCCVDDRGSDPVPENDSQGELIYAVAEAYRYTGDRVLLEAMWPHVEAAVRYMDQLRLGERNEANRKLDPAFHGLMPASISHEGYSAKPMHSYWDDFWALRGYKDAVQIAQWLGKDTQVQGFADSRDQFRADLYASIDIATRQHAIDFIPGSAELGDFDPTSTTIALAPGGEQERLPQALLHQTFERYWQEFTARRDGRRDWDAYTPYELRTVGSFVRLGWRDRAQQALEFFFRDRQPPGWNQWAEVVSRTPRKPFFLGDLPHAWVASDYVRSALDLFAYVRDNDGALVLAAGIPPGWLAGEGIAVQGLRTPFGALGYTLDRQGRTLHLRIDAGSHPPGGFVLPWLCAGEPGVARIDGKPAQWRDNQLRIGSAPAEVEIQLAYDSHGEPRCLGR
ncbi:MAG: discoidin domain-containing protein [Luteimonas sp.]